MQSRRRFIQACAFAVLSSLMVLPSTAHAQHAAGLYDPEPPADSAYVRILIVNSPSPLELRVDGKVRVERLMPGEVSAYLVLPAGKRQLTLHAIGKSSPIQTYTLETPRAKSLTLSFAAAATSPIIFEDKGNTNRLKAVIAAYHLGEKTGPVDVLTADGSTRVFSALNPGTSTSLQVNPISIELIAAKAGDKAQIAGSNKAPLQMTQGNTYSIFLVPDSKGTMHVKTVENKTERFTGKTVQ